MDDPFSSADDADGYAEPPLPGTLPTAVPTRARHDGWTAQRQHDFIAALAECGCVAEACAAVGVSARSAYRLRARPDASIFRQAWDVALDYAIRRLSDAALGRALNGVKTPIFYRGEQVGERVQYDERLTRFLLRYRDPVRYGAWLDSYEARRHPDGAGITLAHALNAVVDAAQDAEPFEHEDAQVPLAEGPRHPVPAHARLYDGPPEGAKLFADIAMACQNERNEQLANDPTLADNRSPLTVRRPRRGDSKGGVA